MSDSSLTPSPTIPHASGCAELLQPAQLRLRIDPASLGFASTAELLNEPFSWIGQQRAQAAAEFGLAQDLPDYHLFVLGEEGSGRTSLLRHAMLAAAARRPAAPDIAFVHNFVVPEHPQAVRLPAGQGRIVRRRVAALIDKLPEQLDKLANEDTHRRQIEQLYNQARQQEEAGFATLCGWAEGMGLRVRREEGQLVVDAAPDGETENLEGNQPLAPVQQAPAAINFEEPLSPVAAPDTAPRRADLEYELRLQLAQFRGQMRRAHIARDEALNRYYQSLAAPLWQAGIARVLGGITPTADHLATLQRWLAQMQQEWTKQMPLWVPTSIAQDADALLDTTDSLEGEGESQDARDDARARREEKHRALKQRSQLNLLVDHHGATRAPVVLEDQPSLRNLFGTIDPPGDDGHHHSDFSCIRAGSLLRADGGYLLLHLRDMVGDEPCWQALRRVLRTRQLRIDDVHASQGPGSAGSLQPEALHLSVKLVLIGSEESYYQLQETDPDMARRFRVKVDFAEQFKATPATYRATAALMAQRCALYRLPQCDASAVARLLEQSHRAADDQLRQSGQLNHLEALLIESAQRARQSGTERLVTAADVNAAIHAHRQRHNAMEEALHDAIADGEHMIAFSGTRVGQLNGLSQIDTGDHCFGLPVRISARTYAGVDGLVNIEREVAMSGPIHDKGVLILQSYLTALFAHLAPLALNASVVFEQEYSGVEGDSASCAELYALLSSLSGVPLLQNIAVTGALNQHGEVLPVGGLNEKIEGWFDLCAAQGDGANCGVLIPARNQRHLMLAPRVVDAVAAGRFHVYTASHVAQGMALMTGQCDQSASQQLPAAVLQGAEASLLQYRRAVQRANARPRAKGRSA